MELIDYLGDPSWDAYKTETDYLALMLPCDDFVSMAEVRYVREHLKKGIGPTRTTFDEGWHKNFNNDAIRKVHSHELDRMLKFTCNVVFYYRHFPFLWRCATISALDKSSKIDYWDMESYRGISHILQGGKLLENLIFYRMRYVAGVTQKDSGYGN